MKLKNLFLFGITLFCLLIAGETMAQSFVKDLNITPNEATIQFEENPSMGYLIEIGGPGSYYWKTQVTDEKEITFKNKRQDGGSFADGNYTMQITPIIMLTPEQRTEMRAISNSGNAEEIAAFKTKVGIPNEVKFYNYNFHITQGDFVLPQKEEKMRTPSMSTNKAEEHFGSYASLTQRLSISSNFSGRSWGDNTMLNSDDQVILDDLIVDGSACIGQDCVNGESFGFDTVRLKENNLRIKAQDTSNSASFPTNDWQITFNDSSNGGANKFSIDDIDGGRTPFTIEASSPTHSLYVDNGGRIGFGTSTPVVELHSKNGDTPTLRLEQDGSSGFTPQTWDVAGNETNFFVRDASNGSRLPFKIRPGASDNSIYIDTDGDIGMGTSAPTSGAALDINSTDALRIPRGTVGTRPGGAEGMLRSNLDENSLEFHDGTAWNNILVEESQGKIGIENTGAAANISVNRTDGKSYALVAGGSFSGFYYDNTGSFAVQGMASPHSATSFPLATDLVVTGTGITVGTNGSGHTGESNAWNTFSDGNLKRDLRIIDNPISKIKSLNGYYYYWLKDRKDQSEQVGVVAQEVEAVLPQIVKTNKENIKTVDYSKLTALLIEAVKEQQQTIDSQQNEINVLNAELAELKTLKAQVAQLTELVLKQKDEAESASSEYGKE